VISSSSCLYRYDLFGSEFYLVDVGTTLRNITETTLGYMAKERKEWISDITWDKTDGRRLLKAQICRGRDLSEQRKRLLSEDYRSLDKGVKC
jgi:hypothetical protein